MKILKIEQYKADVDGPVPYPVTPGAFSGWLKQSNLFSLMLKLQTKLET